MGSFANWECRTGIVSGYGGVNTVTWSGMSQLDDRHQLIAPDSRELDDFGRFPKVCPNTNSYSVQLGNSNNGHEAEGLFYTYTIPANNNNFSLLFYYAVVLQNPTHNPHEQPRFRARVVDAETNTDINCVSFDFSSSGSLPGFRNASFYTDVLYKDWTPVTVDLSGYAGKTIRLEFITSDCVYQEHFGYAYISIGSNCSNSISGGYYCEGDSVISASAPYGYAGYSWYSDVNFTNVISRSQVLELDTGVARIGSVFPVVVFPYEGYGCQDTLYLTINPSKKPIAEAGPDLSACVKTSVQIGAPGNPLYAYSWSPDAFLADPGSSNPSTLPTLREATEFVVKTTDIATGCFSHDTVVVTPVLVDTASMGSGRMVYCPDEMIDASLAVSNTATTVQWYKDLQPLAGTTSFTYQPATTGTYWAQVRQFGCVDSTRLYAVHRVPLPKPDFAANREVQCVGGPVIFTNRTNLPANEPASYLWRFEDGMTSQAVNADRTFSSTGLKKVTLVATTGNNCTDSIQKYVTIINSCAPLLPTAFTPNRDGKNDVLEPLLLTVKQLKRFAVYNRWGGVVFSTSKEGVGWDGTQNGKPLPSGVFVWLLEYVNKDNIAVVEKGTVTLIR